MSYHHLLPALVKEQNKLQLEVLWQISVQEKINVIFGGKCESCESFLFWIKINIVII